jgi:hypothetical protein
MAIVYFDEPKSKVDPNRPANALLLAQVQHLREAEKSLPPDYHSGIFSHAIRTEGEVAQYVKAVTEAIHRAHADAAALRVRRPKKRKGVIEIAAVADEATERQPRSRQKNRAPRKTAKKKRGRKE